MANKGNHSAMGTKDKIVRQRAKSSQYVQVIEWNTAGLEKLKKHTFKLQPKGAERMSLGLRFRDRTGMINALKRGFPVSSFDRLQHVFDIPTARLSEVVNISGRTLARRKAGGRLQTNESERVLRLGILFDQAIEVLGGINQARQWFKTPKKALGGKTPLEYADTELGAREVENLLGRLEHGVFS